jgi:adenine-specific DNA methylase
MKNLRKSAILEQWFAIDRILFNKNPRKVLGEQDYAEYLTNKAAFLSNLYEMYKVVGYKPNNKSTSLKEIVSHSGVVAKAALKQAKTILENSNVISIVKDEIKHVGEREALSESQVAQFVIKRRRNAVAIDSMAIDNVINESNSHQLKDWRGAVLVDAHKVLRDQMIDSAL